MAKKEKINIIYWEGEKYAYKEQEAKRIPGTENFYVFKYDSNTYNCYSLTIIPSGIAIAFFKYKKDAIYVAKELHKHKDELDFAQDYKKLRENKELIFLVNEINDRINSGSNFVRVGTLKNFVAC